MTFERLIQSGFHRFQNVDRYLQAGGDTNHRTPAGQSLLHLGADNALLDLIHFLAAHGADLNARGHHGYTPLHLAVDTDCNTQSRDGRRATHLPLTQALITLGADEAVQDDDGQTPRDIAIAYGPTETTLYDRIPRR